jgi:hypothetical protein
VSLKRASTTPALHSTRGGGRIEGALSLQPLRFAFKNVNCVYINIKSTLKITFLLQTPETKKFVKIFCEALWTFNKNKSGIQERLFWSKSRED